MLPNVGGVFAAVGDSLLAKRLHELNLSCEQIVMELVELNAESEERLKDAAHSIAENGFKLLLMILVLKRQQEQRLIRHINPHIIKIDRSVMLDFEQGDTSEMELVLDLANQIGAKTVIEGIETQQQLAAIAKQASICIKAILAMPKPIELNLHINPLAPLYSLFYRKPLYHWLAAFNYLSLS
ncbi:EAL domain-containing protein [Vibrio lentus]|nr:EAL domain-containing protein [Vibrio lentus]